MLTFVTSSGRTQGILFYCTDFQSYISFDVNIIFRWGKFIIKIQ